VDCILGRIIPLKPEKVYKVIFDETFLGEIADHPKVDELLEEIDGDLSVAEKHLARDTVTKVHEERGVQIWRHKPGTDKQVRILYSPQGKERWVVDSIPRRTDYRRNDLNTAIKRVLGKID